MASWLAYDPITADRGRLKRLGVSEDVRASIDANAAVLVGATQQAIDGPLPAHRRAVTTPNTSLLANDLLGDAAIPSADSIATTVEKALQP